MKKTLRFLSSSAFAMSLAVMAGFSTNAQADNGFEAYKGTCWGIFYDYNDLNNPTSVIPTDYVRATEDCYVLPNFLGCGKNLIVNFGDADEEGYCNVTLEMEGAQYDDSSNAYFYTPFSDGHDWSFMATNGENVGPISQAWSSFHEPFEYISLFYVSYLPQVHYMYFDVKTQEDYYENSPREFIDQAEVDDLLGVTSVLAPRVETTRDEVPAFTLSGIRAAEGVHGVTIESGRKVVR